MKVKIIKTTDDDFYEVGEIYEVYETYRTKIGRNEIKRSDCILLSEEPGNRIPFSYETWKEKGGKVWYNNDEVSQLIQFDVIDPHNYVGVRDRSLFVCSASDLTMSAPDRVEYFNVCRDMTYSGHRSIESAMSSANPTALHILEVNHTQGTNRIVHRYNTEK